MWDAQLNGKTVLLNDKHIHTYIHLYTHKHSHTFCLCYMYSYITEEEIKNLNMLYKNKIINEYKDYQKLLINIQDAKSLERFKDKLITLVRKFQELENKIT